MKLEALDGIVRCGACVALVVLFVSCSPLGGPREVDDRLAFRPQVVGYEEQASFPIHLMVSPPQSFATGTGNRLAFSPDGVSRQYYVKSRYSEPFIQRLGIQLLIDLEHYSGFERVTSVGALSTGEFLLETIVLDAFHDASTEPGQMVFDVLVRLRHPKSSDGERHAFQRVKERFRYEVALDEYSARGALRALEVAYVRFFADLVHWLAEAVEESSLS